MNVSAHVVLQTLRVGALLWLAAGLVAFSFGREVWLGVLLGGGLGLLNFWCLTRIVRAVFHASAARAAWLGLLLVTKFGLLMALIFLAIRYVGVDAIAFLGGFSIFVVAIFAASARRALTSTRSA